MEGSDNEQGKIEALNAEENGYKDQIGQEITIRPLKEGLSKAHITNNQRHIGTMQNTNFLTAFRPFLPSAN